MAFLHDDVIEQPAEDIAAQATHLFICSQEPATLAEANSTYKLGTKATPTFTGPVDGDTSGRKVTVDAITGGSPGTVDTTGTATHWALCSATKLLAANTLAASQLVTAPNPFTLAAFDIEFPDP